MMEKRLLTPKEIAQATIDAGVAKTKLSIMPDDHTGDFCRSIYRIWWPRCNHYRTNLCQY